MQLNRASFDTFFQFHQHNFPQHVSNFQAIKWTCRKKDKHQFPISQNIVQANFLRILRWVSWISREFLEFIFFLLPSSCKKSTHLFSSSNFCSSIKSCNFCECSLFIASVAVCSPSAWCEQYSRATLAL